MKSSKVSIKTRSTPASLSFKGQATKHTTVKWSIDVFVGCQFLVGELSADRLLTINRQLEKLFFKITELLFYLNNNLHGVVLSPVFTMEVY